MILYTMDNSGNDCSHELVIDYIDIDLDTSKQIVYCEKCYCTFPFEFIDLYGRSANLSRRTTTVSTSSRQ